MTMDQEYPRSWKYAKENGYKLYYTGKACKRGHVCPRRTCNKICLECEKEYYEENSEKFKERSKEHYHEHKDNLDKLLRRKEWEENNKEYIREYKREYYQQNKERLSAMGYLRHKNRKMAIVSWSDESEVDSIYRLAKDRGLAVDHIVPLISDYVCGLHVADNLRCIPNKLNNRKGNRYWPNMPEEIKPKFLFPDTFRA